MYRNPKELRRTIFHQGLLVKGVSTGSFWEQRGFCALILLLSLSPVARVKYLGVLAPLDARVCLGSPCTPSLGSP